MEYIQLNILVLVPVVLSIDNIKKIYEIHSTQYTSTSTSSIILVDYKYFTLPKK